MIAIHGTADPVTPYHGGTSWVSRRAFPDIPDWVQKWARRNHCTPKPVDVDVASDVTRRSYSHCADNADVVLYSVRGGGHVWPGGGPLPEWLVGKNSNSIDASQQMWQFFRQHKLRR